MFYKIILERGHMGAGSGFEEVRFIKSKSPFEAMQRAGRLPGAKSRAVKLVMRVSRAEYLGASKALWH